MSLFSRIRKVRVTKMLEAVQEAYAGGSVRTRGKEVAKNPCDSGIRMRGRPPKMDNVYGTVFC